MFAVSTKQAEARRAAAAPLAGPAPGPLSMYAAPPVEEVTLEDFEGFAIDRLRGAAPSLPPQHAAQAAWRRARLLPSTGAGYMRRPAGAQPGGAQVAAGGRARPSDAPAREGAESGALSPRAVLKAIEEAQSRGKKPEEIKARGPPPAGALSRPLPSLPPQSLIATKLHETRLNVRRRPLPPCARARARAERPRAPAGVGG